MASPISTLLIFIFFITLSPYILLLRSATVVEDLVKLHPPPDFNVTISNNCLHNPSLRYCNSSNFDILEIFRSTIVASHLCNESKNPNCIESFPKINLHGRPKTASLYLSFSFFWKYCPLSILTIDLSNNSLKGSFPSDILSCSQIQSLNLSHNEFSGDVPLDMFSPLNNLTHLNLSFNRFSETKISDSEFFKRFDSSSFIRSGLLPNHQHYKIKFLILLIAFPTIVLLFICCLGWLCLKRPDYLPRILQRTHRFTPTILNAATKGFSRENLVSKNKEVKIYKGTLRDGTETRIEIYTDEVSRDKRREFEEECIVLVQLRHRNLVRVLGWCNNRKMRALVTEWTDGDNIQSWLTRSSAPSWKRRLKVVKGIVEGMCYLRDRRPEILYDLRTSNVLLSDNDQEPLISRFKIGDGNNSSNIYKFGLFLLEIITNLRPDEGKEGSDCGYLQYIRVHYPENLQRVIDKRMKLTEHTFDQAKQGICLALMCTDKTSVKQPSLGQISNLTTSLYESCLAAGSQNQKRHHSNMK